MIIKYRITLITATILLLISSRLTGQYERIDSMERVLDTADLTVRAYTLAELTWAYRSINPDRGIRCGLEAAKLLEDIGDRKMLAECLLYLGVCHYLISDFDNSLDYYFRSMQIKEELNDREGVAAILNNLGNVSKEMANYQKAADYYRQAEKLGRETGNRKILSTALANLAVCYRLLKDPDTALIYNLEALRIREEIGDRKGIGGSLNNIAVIYSDTLFQGYDPATALEYFERSLEIKEEQGDQIGICQTLINIGMLQTDLGRFDLGRSMLERALAISKELGSSSLLMASYAHLAEFYRKTGDFRKAFSYQVIYTDMMDSVYIEDNKQQIAEMQVRYETQKKEQENELLKKQTEIQTLQITRHRNFRNFFIILAVLLLGLAVALYSRYRLKMRTNRLLEEKNSQLAVLNATRDKFFRIIAHDLKNPFSMLLQVSGQLKERYADFSEEQRLHIISLISNSTVQTHELLANLLDWSVAQSGNMPVKMEKIPLLEVVASTFELLRLSADKKDLRLVSMVNGGTQVLADRNMLATVLRNLVSNAIKFSDKPGEIRVSGLITDGIVEVNVSDQGIGMRGEDLGKLFRIDVNHTQYGPSREKGTGLGLILCREFVEKMGGTIRAESVEGEGSSFIFTLATAEQEGL